jgi:hypothetical protein
MAVRAVLSTPEADGNEALAGLVHFLVIPEPVVEELPALFLPPGVEEGVDAAALLKIAVAGKILYAKIRWLDDLADSAKPSGDPSGAVHRLAEGVTREALGRFDAVLYGNDGAAGFFSSLAVLNLRYAASLAIDGASRVSAAPASLGLDDYVTHAKARAAPMRAPLDALLVLVSADKETAEAAHSCFEVTAAAKQLHDDAADVEEDYRDGRLSWVVAETLLRLGNPDPRPGADEFYEAALLKGVVERNLAETEKLYLEAMALAEDRFPGCLSYLMREAREARTMKEDLARIVARGNDTHEE